MGRIVLFLLNESNVERDNLSDSENPSALQSRSLRVWKDPRGTIGADRKLRQGGPTETVS